MNDPHIKHGPESRRQIAKANFPSMESKKRKVSKDKSQDSPATAENEETYIEIDLPEYDLRSLATAQDPHAVVEGYRINIYLRLSTVLGVRMCPNCPDCNKSPFGCQDRFGSNMRPVGGSAGGMPALVGSTEHQALGTPHFHGEGHVVSAYQFDTMKEIAEKFQQSKITLDEWKHHNAWLHREEVLHPSTHAAFKEKVDEEFASRYSGKEHDGLSVIPSYLMDNANNWNALKVNKEVLTVSNALDLIDKVRLREDGAIFKQNYFRDAQFVFSRVQHHCHQKTAKGYVPFKACRVKQKGRTRIKVVG